MKPIRFTATIPFFAPVYIRSTLRYCRGLHKDNWCFMDGKYYTVHLGTNPAIERIKRKLKGHRYTETTDGNNIIITTIGA